MSKLGDGPPVQLSGGLSRSELNSETYRKHFAHLPPERVLDARQVRASMQRTLAMRPPQSEDTWVFAYGSLIWNPLLAHEEQCGATLPGWSRRFSMRLVAGRATLAKPGRMLTVEAGGSVTGTAFRLGKEVAERELECLWLREMVLNSYVPRWLPIELDDGRVVEAIVFTVNRDPDHWSSISAPSQVAEIVAYAQGPLGSNADYVRILASSLRLKGIGDAYIESVAAHLDALTPNQAPDAI